MYGWSLLQNQIYLVLPILDGSVKEMDGLLFGQLFLTLQNAETSSVASARVIAPLAHVGKQTWSAHLTARANAKRNKLKSILPLSNRVI